MRLQGDPAPLRHDASRRDAVGGNSPPPGYRRVCLECGEPYEGDKPFGAFCCPGHRAAFNARRAQRGAELYDLVMAWRYQRGPTTKALGLWKLVCRMAQAFRDEDWRERAGRRSWRPIGQVLAERPWLHAVVVHNKTWRRPNG